MDINTHIGSARACVHAEQEAIDAKQDAFEAFMQRIREIPTDHAPASSTGVATVAGARRRSTSMTDSGCQKVLTAFAETVRPHSIDDVDADEPLLETVRSEFTESIAVALAPTTEASFTPELEEILLAEVETRQAAATAFNRALDREITQLDRADEVVDEITGWMLRSEEPPLSAIEFNALKLRHEALDRHRARCDDLVQRRQEFFDETTSNGVKAGICHRQCVPYLYDELPVDYPVLATSAGLNAACVEYQRAVRDHLTRGV